MLELNETEMEQVNGAGGGVHVGSDGANKSVGNVVLRSLAGGHIDPNGANNQR